MMYKGVAKKDPLPGGGPISFLIASSDSPTGPFSKALKPILSKADWGVATEDPCIWTGKDRYWGIIRIDGSPVVSQAGTTFTDKNHSLILVESVDGFDWKPSRHALVTTMDLRWAGWPGHPMICIERPQLCLDQGRPVALVCASTSFYDNHDGSFIVAIPLKNPSDSAPGGP